MANIITKPYTVATNPNLLDNCHFADGGVICQRAETSHTGTGYWLDRWFGGNNSGSASISSSGLTVTGANNWHTQCQTIENGPALLNGKTVTISALLGNNMLIKGTVKVALTSTGRNLLTVPIRSAGVIIGYICLAGSTETVNVQLRAQAGESVTFKAAKLELGDCQTLAHYVQDSDDSFHFEVNEIPNYTEELLKCQRYFVRYTAASNAIVAIGAAVDATHVAATIALPTTMRTSGTPTISGDIDVYRNTSGSAVSVTAIALHTVVGNLASVLIGSSGLTQGETVRLVLLQGKSFAISKEL